ncbi:unnamed protein product [Nyctereutes procyonoides]|uniref:(raccoon dog) hypothetical protein n=1 Tax=Nyctereutes procyonoides TaxID=34880 RepID=A0A811ZZ62_NYCPR|nr:unnamed protein product [Nyctereutes procyonoides]
MLRALRPGCAPGDPGCFLPWAGSFQCPLLMKLEILPPTKEKLPLSQNAGQRRVNLQ